MGSRGLKGQDRMMSIQPKLPFLAVDGKWWIYRDDDDRRTPVPLGPFFTYEYAWECKTKAQVSMADLPATLDHEYPSAGPDPAFMTSPLRQRVAAYCNVGIHDGYTHGSY